MLQSEGHCLWAASFCVCGGPPLGKLSGGNWIACGCALEGLAAGACPGWVPASARPDPVTTPFAPSWGVPRPVDPHGEAGLVTIVTWLILPVVICLSQRLSHACLSISNLYCETANGSLNQLSFI